MGHKSAAFDRRDMQIQPYTGQPPVNYNDVETKTSKGKSRSENMWCFSDPEFQRKKRVASYKVYAVEGRVKGTFRISFRWLKSKCAKVVGWW